MIGLNKCAIKDYLDGNNELEFTVWLKGKNKISDIAKNTYNKLQIAFL